MIFSVIVPFLNEETYIEQCISSLINQDFDKKEYELIFVDNDSNDNSAKIVKRFPEVILLAEKRKYAYAARNKGIKTAKGEIAAFIDADCTASKNWLTEIYEGMKKNNAEIALGKCSFPENASSLLRFFEHYEAVKTEYVLGACPKEYFFGYTRNMAVRTDIFKALGAFIESPILGDTEFIQRYVSQNKKPKIAYLNNMEITHREITDLKSWLRKISAYGEHSRHKNMKDYRPLNYSIKSGIFNLCAKDKGYTLPQTLVFSFLLMAGDIAYKKGRLKKYIKPLWK